MTRLVRWWRLLSGREMAEQAAHGRGWMEGFNAGLKVTMGVQRGVGFMEGFVEGRESTRTEPLGAPVVEEQGLSCLSD